MTDVRLGAEGVRAACSLAQCAPSLFNVQPWRWSHVGGSLELWLDTSLELPETDPDGRELVISCGAALFHAVLSLRARGRRVAVDRMPDSVTPALLARIRAAGDCDPLTSDRALVRAARRRHVDRRRFAPVPVSPGQLLDVASANDVVGLSVITGDQRYALAQAFTKAAVIHAASATYRDELARWTGREVGTPAGMAEESAPWHGQRYGDIVMRDFGQGEVQAAETGSEVSAGSLLLISTSTDRREAHLRAGEVLGELLCRAELAGLAACPLSEAFEVPRTRAAVRREVLDDAAHPQLVVRVGWPASGEKPRASARRKVTEALSPESCLP